MTFLIRGKIIKMKPVPPEDSRNLLTPYQFFIVNLNFKLLDGTKANERAWEEIRIEVPWGHVAGKWYGDRSQQAVIGRYCLQNEYL